MHTGTRPFKGIQLTLTAPLRGCGFHVVWVGGIALHRPDWENYNNKKKHIKTVRWQEICTYMCVSRKCLCVSLRGERWSELLL